jgi:hypothetical protein
MTSTELSTEQSIKLVRDLVHAVHRTTLLHYTQTRGSLDKANRQESKALREVLSALVDPMLFSDEEIQKLIWE